MYCLDHAEEYFPVTKTLTEIVRHIRIDGRQDVLSAHARPDIEDAERLGDDDNSKYLMNHAGDLIYSMYSARLGIHPHFRVKHEMARLEFKVKSAGTGKIDGLVKIEAIGVMVPREGEFTVAADYAGISSDWNDLENLPPTGVKWKGKIDTLFIPTEQTPEDFGSTLNLDLCRFSPAIEIDKHTEREISIKSPLLVPPLSKIGFCIYYRYYPDPEEDDAPPSMPEGILLKRVFSVQELQDGGLIAGQRNVILLTIYGPSKIWLEVNGSEFMWNSGGDIPTGRPEDE